MQYIKNGLRLRLRMDIYMPNATKPYTENLLEKTITNILSLAISNVSLKADVQNFVDSYLQDRVFKSSVDLGCGSGFYGRMLRKHAIKLTGIDLDIDAVDEAQGYNKIFLGDIKLFDQYVPDFDAIFLFDVIEHLTKEEGIELLSKAKEKAFVAIATPSKFSNSVQELFTQFNPHKHKCVWTIEEFHKLGFKVWLFQREGYWGMKYSHHIVGLFDK